MCTNYIDMTAHTPVFFTESCTIHIYVEHNTAGHGHRSPRAMQITHLGFNWIHNCLTSVIECKTLAICHVPPQYGKDILFAVTHSLQSPISKSMRCYIQV